MLMFSFFFTVEFKFFILIKNDNIGLYSSSGSFFPFPMLTLISVLDLYLA